MNIYYEHMPEDFKKAVEIIMQYCQNEDCDCDCNECPYTLAEIRCGDVIRSEIPNTCGDAISRTGQWIDDEFGSKCSCCGIYTHLDKFDKPMKFKRCSMCGAKMEVKE